MSNILICRIPKGQIFSGTLSKTSNGSGSCRLKDPDPKHRPDPQKCDELNSVADPDPELLGNPDPNP